MPDANPQETPPLPRRAAAAQTVREVLPPLAEVARSLADALGVEEVARRVTASALELSEARGAYVERILPEEGTVEIVAAAGEGVPRVGTRVAYPGSLTEEVLESGLPSVVTELGRIGLSVAPYLKERCARCSGLVVPLLSESEVLGTLVLLRGPEQPHYQPKEVTEARMLGDLAAVSMRRVLLLERERRARADAEDAVRARDRVLRIVSHDLKNPLHTIQMAADLMLDIPLEEAQRTRHLRIIRRAGERMERLVSDLLDVARIEAGHGLNTHPVPVEVHSLVGEAMEVLAPQAMEGGQRLESHVPERAPAVMADRDRVLQVLSNLVGNALKFTPEGGRVELRVEPVDGRMCFSVSDTGPGIPGEEIPNLFHAFWQAERTASLGSGLGLAIARGIVRAHGGDIAVDSRVGVGTTFSFWLPLAGAERNGDGPAGRGA